MRLIDTFILFFFSILFMLWNLHVSHESQHLSGGENLTNSKMKQHHNPHRQQYQGHLFSFQVMDIS